MRDIRAYADGPNLMLNLTSRDVLSSRFTLAGTALAALLALVSLAQAEIVQKNGLRVDFEGKTSPRTLPRRGAAPIAVSIGGKIGTANGSEPPQLLSMAIAINREGRFDYAGLPACRRGQIQPATTRDALAACRAAKVGEGSFSANVAIPEQSPFPSKGKIVAFNGTEHGRPVILAHIYGTDPVPTSYTLPLRISRTRGTYGTLLSASLPRVTSNIAFVTGISMRLQRSFRYRGAVHSYLSAGCPAPRGFPSAVFPLIRAKFAFAGGTTLASTLMRTCRAR